MFFFPQLDRPSARRRRRPLNSNSKHADVAREPRPRAPIGSAGARPGRSGARARARRPVLVKARGPGRQWRTRGLGREARLGPIIPLFGRWGYVGSNIWNIETIMEDDIETNEFFATQTYQREGLNNCSLSSKVATVTPSKSDVPFQVRGDRGRILTPEEAEKLINDQSLVSDFKQQKLEIDAQKNWDLFYKRNSTNFFKDRHWTTREFEELKACREFENQKLILLEAGCGVGNCLFPLLEDDLNVFIYACDFSPRAIEFVKQNRLYKVERCKAFQCDLTKDDLLQNVPVDSVDVVTLIFVLSAIHPDKMQLALENIHKILKPGGYILFRDYGLYDHAMLRFKTGHKLGPNFYVRQDGTRSFFFSDEYVAQLLTAAGFEVLVNEYVFRETVNKKEGLCVPRVFLQCKFKKPERILITC